MRLYRHLLRSLPAPIEDHAASIGWSAKQAQDVLRDLERLQLARRSVDGNVRVDDPRATVGRLLDDEEAQLDERRRDLLALRETLESFELDYRRGMMLTGPRLPLWEQIEAAQAVSVVDHLYRTSEGPVMLLVSQFQIGPGHHESVRRQRNEVIASGRPLRTILPLSMLTDSAWHAFAQERAEVGEQQRFLPDDQIKVEFGVFGRSAVVLDEGGGAEDDFILLRSPAVMDVFVTLFDELWRRAEPILNQDASAQDVKLLEYLALGFKDEAMARQLGVSLRTVRRRVAALMEQHGVETRFQLGMAVSSRGVLGDSR